MEVDEDAFPVGVWLEYHGASSCPGCGMTGAMEVKRGYVVDRVFPAGSSPKVTSHLGWEYRCGVCGASGPAEPKRRDTR